MSEQPSSQTWPPGGPWHLPVDGFVITDMTFGALLVDIVARGMGDSARVSAPSVMLRLLGAFELSSPNVEPELLDAGTQDWTALAPLLALRGDRIASAVATGDGHLAISFATGKGLSAAPHPTYENWEVAGRGYRLVAVPGGTVAVFVDGEG
jgi:hypothetical protein